MSAYREGGRESKEIHLSLKMFIIIIIFTIFSDFMFDLVFLLDFRLRGNDGR
jgi:hypothetical protein